MISILDFIRHSYGDASELPEGELIHRKQFEDIKKLFKQQYSRIVDGEECEIDSNDTIAVFAKRGYGKTTFVRSFIHYINASDAYKCCCLDVIDPSMFEMKQHPFIHVLALIQEKVDEYINDHEGMQSPENDRYAEYAEWHRIYTVLLSSLSVLDRVGENNFYKDWNDEEHIARRGMTQAENANRIRMHFSRYIDKSLHLIKKECFVLTFDDIDTNFSKGFEVLEAIRKYLTVSKIVTIMTGDLNLYSKLIRQNLWNGFDRNYIDLEEKNTEGSSAKMQELIDQLEEQYLLKLLKPEYRISLDSLYEKSKDKAVQIRVRYSSGGNDIETDILDVYKQICDILGFKQQASRTSVIGDFIESLPFRTQMRILTAYLKEGEQQKEHLVRAMVRIFRTDISLRSEFSETDIMQVDNFGQYLKFLHAQNCLLNNSNFMPTTTDMTLNKTLLSLGAVANNALGKSLSLVFDYWIRISYMKNGFENEQVSGCIKYSSIDTGQRLNNAYCLSHAYRKTLAPVSVNNTRSESPLQGVCKIADYKTFAKYFVQNPLMGLAMFETTSPANISTCYISLYKLMASIGDIIRDSENLGRVGPTMNANSQFRSYKEPVTGAPEMRREAYQRESREYETSSFDYSVVESELGVWYDKYVRDINVNVNILDRIFTRVFYALNELEENSFNNVGEKFNSMVITLLNSVLIEEALVRGITDVNLDNKGNVVMTFFQNLLVVGKKKSMPFTQAILHCPLLVDFLDPYYKSLMLFVCDRPIGQKYNVMDTAKLRLLQVEECALRLEDQTLDERFDKIKKNNELYEDAIRSIEEYKDKAMEGGSTSDLLKLAQKIIGNLPHEDHEMLDSFWVKNVKEVILNDTIKDSFQKHVIDNYGKMLGIARRKDFIKARRLDISRQVETLKDSVFTVHIKQEENGATLYESLCNVKFA